ncbi:MAG TPA: hypothetical protein ENJ64_03290, partial [Thiotrichales bacterium]|nr:hypothetical protein [Thiotrichales bacterium]
MAGARRRQAITVIDDILAEGSAFDFYQAIRLLDRLTPASVCRPPVNMPAAEEKPRRQAKTVRRQKKTVSRGAGDAAGKLSSIRIRPELNLDYPQADIVAINALDDGGYEILTTFMGLYGVSSPLPGFITEELLDDEWDEQNAAREFIDILHYH